MLRINGLKYSINALENLNFILLTCHRNNCPLKPYLSKRDYTSGLTNSLFSLDSVHISTAFKYLSTFHNFGLPWWISIFSATIILRTVITLPLYIVSAKNAAKLANLRVKEIPRISTDLQQEIKLAMIKYNWDEAMAKSHFHINMKRLVSDLYVKHNCHPLKELILPIIQIPVWFSVSIALRQMANTDNMQLVLNGTIESLSKQGILWFPNLLLPDQYILPVIMCLTNLFIFEMYNLNVDKKSKIQKFGVFFSRSLILLMLPISSMLPACVSYYWTCSSLFGLAQNVVFRLPTARKFFKIPPSSVDSPHFFKDLLNKFKDKLNIK